jgi:putative transposase
MPWGLKRYHDSGHSHFITFTCFHRQRLFTYPSAFAEFERALERIRLDYRMCVYGYVVMPDHVHLLVSETERTTLAVAIKSLKQGVSRRLIDEGEDHFWQKRYYDLNTRNYRQFMEKLRYIHRNPVRAGLCSEPGEWQWSSFIHYATGKEGTVEIESEWTANKRERAAGRMRPKQELPHSSQQEA